MIRAVVWKELREQGLIAIMLAVLGGGLLVATAMFADPPVPGAAPTDVVRALGAGRLVTVMLVVTAGMVCGGALFAAEKEAGTMSFLEALPTGRGALWRAKLVAGLVLATVQVGLLLGAAAALNVADGAFVQRLVVYALLAFAWGTLGSTLARTTLGSVGIAIPAATFATFVFLVPVYLFFAHPGSGMPRPSGWALFQLLMLATPLLLSAWQFTAPDRDRSAHAPSAPRPRGVSRLAPGGRRAGAGHRALVWLTVRQLAVPGAILSAFALAFGLALLLPELRPVFLWPVLALAAGALIGVLAFGDEQARRSAPFWSEHRLPIGRAWAVKMALCAGLLIWLLVLLALPGFLRAQTETSERFGHGRTTFSAVFQSPLFDELGSQTWKYLLLPAVYGFAVGHLCGLLFRKLVVACGVAVMVGGAAVALWAPSLLAGGLMHWQVWVPAGVVLLLGRTLMRPWAAERITDRGPVLRAVIGGCAAGMVLAAGIGYRVVQVPDHPQGEDDLDFVAALTPYEENVAGREFRVAAERFARAAAGGREDRFGDPRRLMQRGERLEAALRTGWPEGDRELGTWLDRVFAEQPREPDEKPWWDQAVEAAARPIGMYESPLLVSSTAATAAALDNARHMALVLLARGLQRQAQRGEPEAFVGSLRTVVALARNMRKGSGMLALMAGIEVERRTMLAAELWLERLGRDAALARAVARAAAEVDDPAPFDPRPHALADRFVIRGMLQAPAPWLTLALATPGASPDRVASEVDLVATAWSVPWEKERTRRLVGLTPDGVARPRMAAFVAGRPGASLLVGRGRARTEMTDADTLLRVGRRAVILKAAIFAHQLEHGTAPAAMSDLVARGYLERVPEDPYADGRPFGYRISTGETLSGPSRPAMPATTPDGVAVFPKDDASVMHIKPGQVVFWSIGADRRDQGGHVPPDGGRAEDLVFVVPLPVPRNP